MILEPKLKENIRYYLDTLNEVEAEIEKLGEPQAWSSEKKVKALALETRRQDAISFLVKNLAFLVLLEGSKKNDGKKAG